MYTFKGKAFISSTNIVQKLLSVTNIPRERMNMIFFFQNNTFKFPPKVSYRFSFVTLH